MLRRLSAAASVVVGVLGCASAARTGSASATTSPVPAIATLAGRYALVALDAHALPFAPQTKGGESASAWTVVSGALMLEENGLFRLETTFDPSQAGAQNAIGFGGTCFAADDQVRMVWEGGSTQLAQRGDTLVVKREGVVYSYLRR